MRDITEHQNPEIWVDADEPHPDNGASHKYDFSYHPHNESFREVQSIRFQRGPVKDNGINGITNEVLLAILIDRYRGLQSGKYPCRENAITLTKLEEALMWQHKRTADRKTRGVEGTNVK